MTLTVKTGTAQYDIICERGSLSRVGELLPLSRKVLIVTDDGVPDRYAEAVAKEMLENSDPGKWICVRAEAVRIGVCGDTIMMVMSSAEEAGALISAFGEVCGGLTLTLEK